MNTIRAWKREQVARYGGVMRLGDRSDFPKLPGDALVSITHGVNMKLFQIIVSTLVNEVFIMPSLVHNENLLYAEGHGNLISGESLLITVWRGKGMVQFRDQGSHGWAKDRLTRFVFGHDVTVWFLTYAPKDHRIPVVEEARYLAETFGKMMVNGFFVRSAVRPVFVNETQA
jgi:hypothetical protein